MPLNYVASALTFLLLVVSNIVLADLRDDVGYTALVNQLSPGGVVEGASVAVLQVEAGEGEAYFPDTANAEFLASDISKTFINLDDDINSAQSSHATSVGRNFYGNSSSLTPEVNDIGIYSANAFLSEALKNSGSNDEIPYASLRRVVNHSWVGGFYPLSNGDNDIDKTSNTLKRLDWLIDHDDIIQVIGTNNGSSSRPLLASAFNGITVGRTDGNHSNTTVPVDSFYGSARPAIHLVAPQANVSNATPTVASAAALLIAAGGQNPGWSTALLPSTNRAGTIIYDAQRSETIKALLMAGASRLTINSSAYGDIDDYRQVSAQQTENGLDRRYGAGQLNIQHSYQILSSTEQASQQDGGSLQVQTTGFDYDPAFGGSSGSNSVADYDLGQIDTDGFLVASLVWNAEVTGEVELPPPWWSSDPIIVFDDDASREQLKLSLLKIASNGTESLVVESISTVSNTQNIWLAVDQGVHYKLRVEPLSGPFNHGYALAWQLRPFDDYDQDGSFDHQDSEVRDPCLPAVFTAPCTQDTDLDGLSDFAEGELTDSDSDGLLDYQESNIIDSDGDGYMDHEDPYNQDPCLPDALLCPVNIPVMPPVFSLFLGALLLITVRYLPVNTRSS